MVYTYFSIPLVVSYSVLLLPLICMSILSWPALLLVIYCVLFAIVMGNAMKRHSYQPPSPLSSAHVYCLLQPGIRGDLGGVTCNTVVKTRAKHRRQERLDYLTQHFVLFNKATWLVRKYIARRKMWLSQELISGML